MKSATVQLCVLVFVTLLFLNTSESIANEQKHDTTSIGELNTSSSTNVLGMKDIHHQLLDQLSEEERTWYNKFQDGLMFFDGWKDISRDILICLPKEEQGDTRRLLEAMGVRIGTEWSKDNTIRKIDTDQLRNWGDRLKQARQEGPQHLQEMVRIISTEVDAILQQE